MAKVYQPGDPRDFGEAMVLEHKMRRQRDKLRGALESILLNAEIQPDQNMDGSTDIYAVPLDDIDKARAALMEIDNG